MWNPRRPRPVRRRIRPIARCASSCIGAARPAQRHVCRSVTYTVCPCMRRLRAFLSPVRAGASHFRERHRSCEAVGRLHCHVSTGKREPGRHRRTRPASRRRSTHACCGSAAASGRLTRAHSGQSSTPSHTCSRHFRLRRCGPVRFSWHFCSQHLPPLPPYPVRRLRALRTPMLRRRFAASSSTAWVSPLLTYRSSSMR